MKKYIAAALLVLFAQSAHADVLCVKSSQKLKVSSSKRVTVKLSDLIKSSATTCPTGFTQLTNFVTQVPEKTTYTGIWNLSGAPGENYAAAEISFPEALTVAPTQVIFVQAGTTNATCTGSVTNPTAPTGKLCVYEGYADNLLAFANRYIIYSTNGDQSGVASKFGGALYGYNLNGAANFYAWGTWAVTK